MSWERQMIRELQQLGISPSEAAFPNRFSKKHAISIQTPRLSYSASLFIFHRSSHLPTPGLTSAKARGIDHEKHIYQYDQVFKFKIFILLKFLLPMLQSRRTLTTGQ
jgi:hypothetical protein